MRANSLRKLSATAETCVNLIDKDFKISTIQYRIGQKSPSLLMRL
jgi:hypothetical protein